MAIDIDWRVTVYVKIYTKNGPSDISFMGKNGLRVLVEGPFGVFFKNVGRTIKLVRRAKPDDIWLLTSSDIPWYPHVGRVYSRIPIDRVPGVYRACDVLVKLSYVEGMFGPPLEIFHCGGTAIVYDVSGHDEYIVNDYNALVVKRDDEDGVVNAIKRLRNDPELLEKLKEGAQQTANAWPDWSESSFNFLAGIEDIMNEPAVDRDFLEMCNQSALMTYSEEEENRIAANPGIKVRYKLDAMLDKIPQGLARSLRFGRYILEGL